MPSICLPVPCLRTAHSGPLFPVEEVIINHVTTIETWFRTSWAKTPAPIMSSVDLRHAGYKLAPVDTNLFPGGFNNLNPDCMSLCIHAIQSTLGTRCVRILLLPENHTRNKFYMQNLAVLRDILTKAGFIVRIGSLDETLTEPLQVPIEQGDNILLEPLVRNGDKVGLPDFNPCLLLLNNDLSNGIPDILNNLKQRIEPAPQLGWASRLKSDHFHYYDQVVNEFANLIDLDPWLINSRFKAIEGVDFMMQTGLEFLAEAVDEMLVSIREKYAAYGISDKPFVVVKADNGTYGMSVMMIQDAAQLLHLNRKQRTGMAKTKGSRVVDRVIIQEGVYTFETTQQGFVAEPVVYMLGQYVVGGFYRVHEGKGIDDNLNTPGMHFEPLAFVEACNMPSKKLKVADPPNRFYAYGVIARLAALAAAKEIAALGDSQ